MGSELAVVPIGAEIERVLLTGDLSKLTSDQRLSYYKAVCESVGLNPLTNPFQYLQLNGKTVLYAAKNCTDQLRRIYAVSVVDLAETRVDDVFVVTAKVQNGEGRIDMAKGAVSLGTLKGESLANALMKCETKAKRRATLSICGLGMLDETEVDSIPEAVKFDREAYVEQKVAELKAAPVVTVAMPSKTEVTNRQVGVTGDAYYEEIMDDDDPTHGDARFYLSAVKDATDKKGNPYSWIEYGPQKGQSFIARGEELRTAIKALPLNALVTLRFKKDKGYKVAIRLIEPAENVSQDNPDAEPAA